MHSAAGQLALTLSCGYHHCHVTQHGNHINHKTNKGVGQLHIHTLVGAGPIKVSSKLYLLVQITSLKKDRHAALVRFCSASGPVFTVMVMGINVRISVIGSDWYIYTNVYIHVVYSEWVQKL